MNAGLRAQLTDRPVRPLRIVLQHVHQDVRIDQQHQSSVRSSFINSSVRQRTSALPRTASNRSRRGGRAFLAGPGRCKTTSPAALTENSTAAPGNSCSSSRIRLGLSLIHISRGPGPLPRQSLVADGPGAGAGCAGPQPRRGEGAGPAPPGLGSGRAPAAQFPLLTEVISLTQITWKTLISCTVLGIHLSLIHI